MPLACYTSNMYLDKYSGFFSWFVKLQGDVTKTDPSAMGRCSPVTWEAATKLTTAFDDS